MKNALNVLPSITRDRLNFSRVTSTMRVFKKKMPKKYHGKKGHAQRIVFVLRFGKL
jgi:hypothetical protein